MCRACRGEQTAAWQKKNRKAKSEYARERYRANPESGRESSRKWREQNPERAKEVQRLANAKRRDKRRMYQAVREGRLKSASMAPIHADTLEALRLSPCFACGSRERVEIDHIVPISRGGEHVDGNLMALCKRCNGSKNSLTYDEWKASARPRAVALFHP